MKKRTLLFINVIVCIIIFAGFLLIIHLNNDNFNKIVEDDVENISRLSSSTIYAQIDNSLTKPIFVSQTMANDSFLKKWLIDEKTDGDKLNQENVIKEYLSNYKTKYSYDSVFLVSAKSNIYYHYKGINKVVDHSDSHDVWYYDFIDANEPYKLDVDFDEADNDQLTVFVNCRVESEDGTLLGVVGVGVKMHHLQELLRSYETDYDLKTLLINDQGIVQVDSVSQNIETVNFFDNEFCLARKDKILNNRTSPEMYWYPDGSFENCVITKYIKNLNWYIVVQKNTYSIRAILTSQFKIDLFYIVIIILLVLFFSIIVIYSYNRLLLSMATTDDVTNLPNLKMFREIYLRNAKKEACKEGILFMFDIDNFKEINDKYGHLFGNTVLYQISNMVKSQIGGRGLIARFGGDEFIGVIYASAKEASSIFQTLFDNISKSDYLKDSKRITISLGATHITSGNKIDVLMKEADAAMYHSKVNGKNQITYFEKNDTKG